MKSQGDNIERRIRISGLYRQSAAVFTGYHSHYQPAFYSPANSPPSHLNHFTGALTLPPGSEGHNMLIQATTRTET
jgi:hypothetical protein